LKQTRSNIDLALDAKWIVTVNSQQSVLTDHVVLVNHGRIIDIVDRSTAKSNFTIESWVTLDRHVLMPGLVNAHTHSAMSLLRGFADDLPLMEWLEKHIWPAESSFVDEQFMEDGANLAILEMLRGGTTCFNDMYFFPNVVADCVKHSGIRANIGMIVLENPTAWANDSNEYLQKGLLLHDQLRLEDRLTTSFAPHAPYTVEDNSLKRIQTLADELDIQIHMHIHETAFEVKSSVDRFGCRPLERLAQLGLATPRLQAVHMTQLLDEEIDFCAEQGIHVIHCPHSNLKLSSGFSPISKLIERGVNVALGTDGAASNNDLDMFEEMRTAALLSKGVSESPTSIPATKALEMATINGARALGLEDEIGTIEAGKWADLIAVDMEHPRSQPVFDPVAQLVYSVSADQVTDVWVAGKPLLSNQRPVTLNPTRIFQQANVWRDRLQSTTENQ